MSESVILCEGYHDRAFWAGWLLYLGCTDPGLPPVGRTTRTPIDDPWGDRVIGGQFAYLSNTQQFIRVGSLWCARYAAFSTPVCWIPS